MRLLITAGPTREYIDDVRFLSLIGADDVEVMVRAALHKARVTDDIAYSVNVLNIGLVVTVYF